MDNQNQDTNQTYVDQTTEIFWNIEDISTYDPNRMESPYSESPYNNEQGLMVGR